MSVARINGDAEVTTLDAKAGPAEVVTEDDVQDPKKLAAMLGRLLKAASDAARQWRPKVLYFEDVPCGTLSSALSLEHGFGGKVRWSVVNWVSASSAPYALREDATNTTADTLVVLSNTAGTATIRVEQA